MTSIFRPRTLVLFAGDLLFFTLALWLALYLRVSAVPSRDLFVSHLYPFALLFVAWVVVFFIAGLYENSSIILARRALSASLLVAQVINLVIAALFFFFIPLFGIAPKTLLFIYLPVSFALMLLWRAAVFPRLGVQKSERAIMVGEGKELEELKDAMNAAHRAPVRIVEYVYPSVPDLASSVRDAMERNHAPIVIADFDNPHIGEAFPHMYNLLASGVRFIDALTVYEEIFGRIPLSRLTPSWLARNVTGARTLYDVFKRVMDIVAALFIGAISLLFYPFIVLALKLQDGGEALIAMPRVGQGGRAFNFYKFRSMSGNDKGEYGATGTSTLHVTATGRVLRSSRLDELPQLWNVIKGDLSLIGPRPEVPGLVEEYARQIPYYNLRHLVKPGLSGWAQLYHHSDPHHAAAVEETRAKLSYDLYYLKHRSLILDLTIALKTIRRVLMRGNA